ncbi:hypothetical protein [Comamonas testosteroni]|jgi:hypothetical protein|uniref:hypothetical protein n=1 Tax=Comamonas testosteroni TaxID=285 RepID=UPI0026EEED46|nr:hypothetical protein [Comamonas testosteroni]
MENKVEMSGAKSIPAILIAAIAGVVVGVLGSTFVQPKADSSDSHTVNNYLDSSGASQALKDRFNAVNSDWPPTRASLGVILLDAKRAEAQQERASAGSKAPFFVEVHR